VPSVIAGLALLVSAGSLAVSVLAYRHTVASVRAATEENYRGSLTALSGIRDYQVRFTVSGDARFPATARLLWQREITNIGQVPITLQSGEWRLTNPDGSDAGWSRAFLNRDESPVQWPLSIEPGDSAVLLIAAEVPISAPIYSLLQSEGKLESPISRLEIDAFLGQCGTDLFGNESRPLKARPSGFASVARSSGAGQVPILYCNLYTAKGNTPYGQIPEASVYTLSEYTAWLHDADGRGEWSEGVPVPRQQPPPRPEPTIESSGPGKR